MPTRFAAVFAACLALLSFMAGPAFAQSDQEIGQMRLYIQQLEEQVRRLTGENERLTYELNKLGGQSGTGVPPVTSGTLLPPTAEAPQGTSPTGLAGQSVAQDDPLVAPDGAGLEGTGQAPLAQGGAPIDLSTLAAGADGGTGGPAPLPGTQGLGAPPSDLGSQAAGLPAAPQGPMDGSARDEYDVAYGYILTGDYDAAESRFQAWLASFPNDPQAPDAQFWLGESYYQQGKAREAATTFLNLHKSAPQSSKAPDALMKLGMSLASLGEVDAACATLKEVGLRYPNASPNVASRVNEEIKRNKC